MNIGYKKKRDYQTQGNGGPKKEILNNIT
jgi:hypothetical protein